jgi:hypothetical protein
MTPTGNDAERLAKDPVVRYLLDRDPVYRGSTWPSLPTLVTGSRIRWAR